MKNNEYMNNLQLLVDSKNWSLIDETYRQYCLELAGESFVKRINEVDLNKSSAAIKNALLETIERAIELDAKAIYYTSGFDGLVEGSFVTCKDYLKMADVKSRKDEDWGSDVIDGSEPIGAYDFFDIYEESGGLFSIQRRTGTSLYMIIKVLIVIGKMLDEIDRKGLPICFYTGRKFDAIIRLAE